MRRRTLAAAHGGKPGGGIPQKYTPVGFLQSSGTQYIDVGLTLTQNSGIRIDLQLVRAMTGNLFGARETAAKNNFSAYILKSPTRIYFDFGSSSTNRRYFDYSLKRTTFEVDKSGVKLNGSLAASFAAVDDFETPTALLFDIGNTDGNTKIAAKIYGCKFFENGELTADLRPCLDADGAPCFYDTVRRKALYNQGAGSFTWG